jgi:hypothetical protein
MVLTDKVIHVGCTLRSEPEIGMRLASTLSKNPAGWSYGRVGALDFADVPSVEKPSLIDVVTTTILFVTSQRAPYPAHELSGNQPVRSRPRETFLARASTPGISILKPRDLSCGYGHRQILKTREVVSSAEGRLPGQGATGP